MKETLKKIVLVFTLAILLAGGLKAQKTYNSDSLVEFSGLVMSGDSLRALEDVNIRIKNTFYSATSNYQGIFTLVAEKGDTVLFSSIGYKRKSYIIPKTLVGQRYSMVITLTADTFNIDTVFIKPFISRALLPYYFATVDVPEDELDVLARKNMEAEFLKEQAYNLPADGPENQAYYLKKEAAKYYYSGQAPPINILNPFAWAQFVKAWKNGDFKRKKKSYGSD